eukprot:342034-Chlamydomonas_euryale.AAC.4
MPPASLHRHLHHAHATHPRGPPGPPARPKALCNRGRRGACSSLAPQPSGTSHCGFQAPSRCPQTDYKETSCMTHPHTASVPPLLVPSHCRQLARARGRRRAVHPPRCDPRTVSAGRK